MRLPRMIASGLTAVGMLAAALAVAPIAQGAELPSVGTKAPDFTLNSQEGTPVSLKTYRGKWVVLYFYPKDMTQGCTIEAHNFQRDLPKYEQKNAVVLGVSVDTVASHQQFCAKDSLTFKLLADSEHEVTTEYGSLGDYKGTALANRNTFLIDPEGVVRKAWTKVDPQVHSEQVLAALTDLEKGQ